MKRQLCYPKEKVLGILFGTFVGDALGRPFEGTPPVEEEVLVSEIQHIFSSQRYTDDTQMTISIFEEMIENGTIDKESLKNRFLRRFDPSRGYGAGIFTLVKEWKAGTDVDTASHEQFRGYGSYGNGAAMRVAPISLFFSLQETTELFELVKLSAMVTHSHNLGIQGAELQAFLVLLALNGIPESQWYRHITELAFDDVYRRKVGIVNNCLKQDMPVPDAVDRIGNGIVAYEAVPAALYSFLRKPYSFREALIQALALGGDTDTISAMTGAVAGAKFGIDGIPKEWLQVLENDNEGKDFIFNMVDRVF